MNSDDRFDDTVLASIDGIVVGAVEQGQAPGVVAAVARGEIVHVATAGAMAIGGASMRRDTLFRISSMTKPMTAAVVLSLVDAGIVDLDGPVDGTRAVADSRRDRRAGASHFRASTAGRHARSGHMDGAPG